MARRFGIEIETGFGDTASFDSVVESLRAAGLEVNDMRTRYSGNHRTAWSVAYDGSVRSGCEVKSPPLDFDNNDQRAQVTRAILALQSAGCQVVEEAGIHVHVEATNDNGSNFSARQVVSVLRFCHKFEDAIYRIAASGWDGIRRGADEYAQPTRTEVVEALRNVRSISDIFRIYDGTGVFRREVPRPQGCNIRALPIHNTIEFRYFNTTLNPARAQTYIALCIAIMEDARRGQCRHIKTAYPVGSMAEGHVNEDALLLRLQQVLTTTTGDSRKSAMAQNTPLMSKYDWKNLKNLCWRGSKPVENIWGVRYERAV